MYYRSLAQRRPGHQGHHTMGSNATAFQPGGLQGDQADILQPIYWRMLQFTDFIVLALNAVHSPARLPVAEPDAAPAAWPTRLPELSREAPLKIGAY